MAPCPRRPATRRDAAKLATFLRSGDLTEVHVLDEQTEAMRDLERTRDGRTLLTGYDDRDMIAWHERSSAETTRGAIALAPENARQPLALLRISVFTAREK